jgi:hypothetical protein
MRLPRSDFRADRDLNRDEPERNDEPRRWPYKRRTFPQQPKGAYLKILDDLIAQNRSKREAA